MLRKLIYLLLVLAAVLIVYSAAQDDSSLGSPISTDSHTLSVTDLAGRQVTLHRPIERIVLLRGLSFYELAAVMGDDVEDKLVGWDSSLKTGDQDAYEKFLKRYPRLQQIQVLGDSLKDSVSAEAILALNPDLVILNTYMLRRDTTSLAQLERAGVPLLYLDFSDPFHDPQRSIRLLGKVLGKEQRAEAVSEWMDTELESLFHRLQEITVPIPSIYMEAGTHGPDKYGNTFGQDASGKSVNWGSILAQLRCRNIAAGTVSGAYGMGLIRPEYLLAADPDVIVITGANWTTLPHSLHLGYDARPAVAQRQLRAFCKRTGWADLNAVKNDRVHGIHTRMSSHLTSVVAASQLIQWLYPAEFDDLDPEAKLREFHNRFMPIEYSGTWMVNLRDE